MGNCSFENSKGVNNDLYFSESSPPGFWLYCHKPTRVIKIVKSENKFDEMRCTLMFMKEFGKENVRGSSMFSVRL
jgi:hypothetical protein